MDTQLLISLISPVGIGGLFLYIRSLKSDVRDTNKDVKELKNGCFERHAKLEREAGRNEMTTQALHARIDKIDKIERCS